MSELFTPAFVHGIQRLRIAARRAPHTRDAGEHASRSAGSGIDFQDFRRYAPGDDLRRVDWNVYRRSRRLILRLFEEPRRVQMHILLDASDSSFFESPPRANSGRQVVAALAAASAEQHDRVSIYPFGAAIGRPMLMRGGRDLPLVLKEMEELQPAGRTDLAGVLRQFAAIRTRPGLLVLVSDFFDAAGLEPMIAELNRLRHCILLVQLTRTSDRLAQREGDLELVDCENGDVVRVSQGTKASLAYRQAYDAFVARLGEFSRSRGAPLFTIDAEREILPQLQHLFVNGVLRL